MLSEVSPRAQNAHRGSSLAPESKREYSLARTSRGTGEEDRETQSRLRSSPPTAKRCRWNTEGAALPVTMIAETEHSAQELRAKTK